jgi:hypothetical protein
MEINWQVNYIMFLYKLFGWPFRLRGHFAFPD